MPARAGYSLAWRGFRARPGCYTAAMPQPSTPPPRLPPRAANDQTADPLPRTWAVRIIRKRMQFLGHVVALDREAAETEAVALFELTDEQRKRLIITEGR